ncbi:MAG: zinc-binding dehydrogenase [Phormidesmis sp.]
MDQVAAKKFQLPVAGTFALDQVQQAHREMEAGQHIGKFILQP